MDSQNLRELGNSIKMWRKLQAISASRLAARAGISRTTLANIENGKGNTSLANFFAVLEALGIAGQIVKASSPTENEFGRELIYRKVQNG